MSTSAVSKPVSSILKSIASSSPRSVVSAPASNCNSSLILLSAMANAIFCSFVRCVSRMQGTLVMPTAFAAAKRA